MGEIIGRTKTVAGQTIAVVLSADEFQDENLPPITDIAIQMDGGADYSPIKTTTASISLMTDNLDILKICRVEYPVQVAIKDETSDRILFLGYIVPNSYNQQFTGVNDIVTVECVDVLGYAKYIDYSQYNASQGFAAMRLDDIILHVMSLLGIGAKFERLLLPTTVVIARGGDEAALWSAVAAENYFFGSIIPDETTGDYRPQAMTCEKVLSMIAESFHLSWMTDGQDIWLLDELSTTVGDVVYVDAFSGEGVTLSAVRNITEEVFADTTCDVSTLPTVPMTKVTHNRVDEVELLQDPFDDKMLVQDGDYEEYYNAVDDAYNRIISLPLESAIYSTLWPQQEAGGPYSRFVAWCENGSITAAPQGPIFLNDYVWRSGQWNIAVKLSNGLGIPPLQDVRELLRRKVQFSTPVIGQPRGLTRYAARTLHIDIKMVRARTTETFLWPFGEEDIDCKLNVSVIVDGLYYSPEARDYVEEKTIFRINVRKDGTTHWDITDISEGVVAGTGIPVPSCGAIELVIYSNGAADNGWTVAWIKELRLALKGDVSALVGDLTKQADVSVGRWENARRQNLEPQLTFYYNMTQYPLYAPLAGASGLDPELIYKVAGQRLSLAQYAHNRANMGDRLMWRIPLRDEANTISLVDVFTCEQLWRGRKVATGYTRDVLDDKITLTLI